MHCLEDYRGIVGDSTLAELRKKARKLYGKHILNINSTCQGGGVAEILNSLIPLMNDLGIDAGWRILHGNPDFFTITKKFHNALQGETIHLTEMKKQLYIQTNELFSTYTHINHDCVIIHDPQPLPLIKFSKKRQPWIWRCHVDLSNPNSELWNYLTDFLLQYDTVILSNDEYRKDELPIEQRIIHPAIDPLTSKNTDLTDKDITKYLTKFGVKTDKPLITQVSRFDKWKDPEGVIEVFKLVKQKVNCRLVLCGNMATDDPEGAELYQRIHGAARELIEKGDIVLVTDPASSNYIFINALQRKSSVIVQKSIKEGFCLAITEALWKEKPVVVSNVGGLPLQVKEGKNGFLVEPDDAPGFARKIIDILRTPSLAENLGKEGKKIVRDNFLITRLLSDYMDLLIEVLG